MAGLHLQHTIKLDVRKYDRGQKMLSSWNAVQFPIGNNATRILGSGWVNDIHKSFQKRIGSFLSRKSPAETPEAITFTCKFADPESNKAPADADPKGSVLTISVLPSISNISPEEWDACAVDATGEASLNPFLLHSFFMCLEDSGSASRSTGWLPQHLIARDEDGQTLGVVPLYLKNHSYGEYVFDQSWANAYASMGEAYYPKLQSCVPFTPATGPRVLLRNGPMRAAVFEALCGAMKQLVAQFGVSSLHVTFPTMSEWRDMAQLGFLRRTGVQYHWSNRNYSKFDDFLMDLKAGRRKNIRQERKKVAAQGLVLKRLRGDDIKPHHWDAFYSFYINTTDNKWGRAYLNRDFFHQLGDRMGDRVLLVTAEERGVTVAGALNLIGGDTLFGRNWGCRPGAEFPFLHFEACYYQAIEAAIELGLAKVEAGAQGEHKLQRGYVPTPTYSCHYIADDEFRGAVRDFLRRESVQIDMTLEYLTKETNPFKDGIIG